MISGRELGRAKLICYFSSPSAEKTEMALSPESLDPYLCTHIIYHQAKLDAANNKILLENPSVDLKGIKNYEFL